MSFEEHYLFPSAIFASKTPYKVTTVLGTCVAICLWDSKLKVGGINHYMLPLWNGDGLASPKYGNIATEKLLEKMVSFGCRKENLVAKVFGGKNVHIEVDSFKIGQRNVEYALNILEELNIPIKGKSVGGEHGRKLMFHTNTGEVFMKYIAKH